MDTSDRETEALITAMEKRWMDSTARWKGRGAWGRAVAVLCSLFLGTALQNARAQAAPGPSLSADTLTFPQRESLPPWVLDRLAEGKLDAAYRVSTQLNPFYLSGDLDGDGRADAAILVRHIASGKLGIAALQAGSGGTHVLGAGVDVGNGGDDFAWMDFWRIYQKASVPEGPTEDAPPALIGDALLVGKSESASALLYWDGKGYRWYQEGD
jgi:hypothetical protein